MVSHVDIVKAQHRLDEVWDNPPARDGRFGNVLKSVVITNIRGLSAAIELQWPVVAIGGTNGCGKTTVLQVCSAAYTKLGSGQRSYTLGQWIGPALTGETPPVTDPAVVEYSFWESRAKGFDVPYKLSQSRWRYPRRGNPERHVAFFGVADFAPRIEQRGRTHQNRARLRIERTVTLDPRITESISRVLGRRYETAQVHTVTVDRALWHDDVPQLTRSGSAYTEAHMGAGEQKIVRLVQQLERIPEKSLILLEEPELTLHPDAQSGLAWYLMSLARRRGHQVVIATHSPWIFEALPPRGRILLSRHGSGVEVLHGVPFLQVARELADGFSGNRDILLVEDPVSGKLLGEALSTHAPSMRRSASIVHVGSADDVQRMVQRLRGAGLRAVGVRDADHGEHSESGLFSLPGEGCPEACLIDRQIVLAAVPILGGVQEGFDRAKVQGRGHEGAAKAKRILDALCSEMDREREFVLDRLAMTWVKVHQADVENLVRRLQESLDSVSPPR